MRAVQRHVLDDEVTLTDEVVLLEPGRPEVDLNGTQDRRQTIAALWARGVVHHVRGDEVVQDRLHREQFGVGTVPRPRLVRCVFGTRSSARSRVRKVGPRHAGGMPGGPLDELDAVPVRVSDPGRQEVCGAIG